MLNGKTKAGRVNKSEVVRQMAAKLPTGAKARQIADQIRAEHDIEVKPAFIRNVLAKANQPLKKVLAGATQPEPAKPDPNLSPTRDVFGAVVRLLRVIEKVKTVLSPSGIRDVVEAALA